MRLAKRIMYLAIALMPFVMSSCPEEEFPNAYVVKMKENYSGQVLVVESYKYNYGDTIPDFRSIDTVYFYMRENDLEKITGRYYRLNSFYHEFRNIKCTSLNYEDLNDSLVKSISDYVIDTDPFDEVYAYYDDYSLNGLMRMINQNQMKDFDRLK